MNEKKPGISPFLFIGLGFLLFIAVTGYFLITFLNDTILSKPEVSILQPTSPQVIPLGDGYLLVTYAKSDQGLHRVEFYMDQVLINQQIPPSDSAQEMLAQFAWLPQAIGAYDLSFIAYDTQNKPSERASIPIAVIATNLPEQVTQQIQQEFFSLPLQNTAGSSGESDRQDGSNDDRQDEEGDDIWRIDNFNSGGQNQLPNTPPVINLFEVNKTRDGGNAVVDVHVTAVDDTGLSSLLVVLYSWEDLAAIDAIPALCDSMLSCDLSGQFSLNDGAYFLTAKAEDIYANPSDIWIEHVEVLPNHEVPEPPVLIVENQQFNVPVDLLLDSFIDENNRIQLPQQIGGFGNVDPFEEIDPQLECPPFCPPVSINDIDIAVEQSWRANRWLEGQVTLTVPPDFIVEDLEEPGISVYLREGSRSAGDCYIGLAAEQRHINGENATCRIDLPCGGDLNFSPKILEGGVPQYEGNSTIIQALSCPPPKPELTQLHATTNCGGSEKCIIVSWTLPESPDNSYSTDHLVLTRKYADTIILDTREDEFIISPDQTSFVDADPFVDRYYEYLLKSVSADRVESNESRMNIRTPRSVNTWEAVSTDWQESR